MSDSEESKFLTPWEKEPVDWSSCSDQVREAMRLYEPPEGHVPSSIVKQRRKDHRCARCGVKSGSLMMRCHHKDWWCICHWCPVCPNWSDPSFYK
jgi:hypothetical protein